MEKIFPIFPTPVMLSQQAVPDSLVAALIDQFETAEIGPNNRTPLLTHTGMQSPRSHENYRQVAKLVAPKLKAFGEALMGEELDWAIKEIWINKMDRGGAQKMHNHSNSFVSGILYLTPVHPASTTVFYRAVVTSSFFMKNENSRCKIGPYNAPVFRLPQASPGDLVLFPSYVMHEVPSNPLETPRYTVAFNALPGEIDSWGYKLGFK